MPFGVAELGFIRGAASLPRRRRRGGGGSRAAPRGFPPPPAIFLFVLILRHVLTFHWPARSVRQPNSPSIADADRLDEEALLAQFQKLLAGQLVRRRFLDKPEAGSREAAAVGKTDARLFLGEQLILAQCRAKPTGEIDVVRHPLQKASARCTSAVGLPSKTPFLGAAPTRHQQSPAPSFIASVNSFLPRSSMKMKG